MCVVLALLYYDCSILLFAVELQKKDEEAKKSKTSSKKERERERERECLMGKR
jgi:hypothetical protein